MTNIVQRLKVLTVVGTRPEIIKLSAVIKELDRQFDHCLVHSGQNYDYELNQVFFDNLGLRPPDHFLGSAGKSATETIANVLTSIDAVLDLEKPDAFLILGDTNSCFAALSAKKRKIPIFHMEAGNRCFDQRVPEEINRKIIDNLSDVNLVYTDHARGFLLKEGFRPDLVIKTGSPMREILNEHALGIEQSKILDELNLEARKYFVLSLHREENVDDVKTLKAILDTVTEISKEFRAKVIFSVHPRTRNRLDQLVNFDASAFTQMKPLGFFDYIMLQKSSLCVISDSGTLTEEAAILKFAAVMMREAHERPEGMDEATAILAGSSRLSIGNAIRLAIAQANSFEADDVYDYEGAKVASKVARIIASYWHFVKREVWKDFGHPSSR